jgi:hypothetical protein
MNVSDIGGNSRLSAAKQKISDIMSENPWYDFALSIFAGESQRVLPFTTDTSLFVTFLRGIDSNNLTVQWTDVSLALDDTLESFWDDNSGNIVILTDGDDEEIVVSNETQKNIKSLNTQVSIIGVGTREGWYIPNKVYNWERVFVWLNISGLNKLAWELDWEYYNLDEEIIFWANNDIKNKYIKEHTYILWALLFWMIYLTTIYNTLYYAKK